MLAATSMRRPGSSEPAISRACLGTDAALAMDVIGDILTDSQFDAGELEREKNVIVQEIGAVEDTPDDLVFDLLTATAWPDQPIGRPILGTREGVSAFDREAIDRYLARRYSAGATVVAAAGAIEHDHVVGLAQSRLEGLARAPAPAEAPAAYRGGEIKLRKRLEQTHVVVGFEGPPAGAPDHDAAQVFAAAAGGGMSSRLFQEVREKRGLAYSIYAFHWGFSDTGLFGFTPARPTGTRRRSSPPRSIAWLKPRIGSSEPEIQRAQGADEGLARDRPRAARGARSPTLASNPGLWAPAFPRRNDRAGRRHHGRRRSQNRRGHA